MTSKVGRQAGGVCDRRAEMEEEHGGEEGAFAELEKVNKANVAARLNEIKGDKEAKDEAAVLNDWMRRSNEEGDLKRRLKQAEAALDRQGYRRVAETHRGGDQDAGGGRQVARRDRCRHPRRDGSHEPATHPASKRARGALRDSDADADEPTFRSWRPRSAATWSGWGSRGSEARLPADRVGADPGGLGCQGDWRPEAVLSRAAPRGWAPFYAESGAPFHSNAQTCPRTPPIPSPPRICAS